MLKLREWKNTSGHKPLIVKGADSAVILFLNKTFQIIAVI